MKKAFLHETHRRQDKAHRPDYQEDLKASTASPASWSGLSGQRIGARYEAREKEKRRASTLFFVYGAWLYQHTRSLRHFVFINSKHVQLCNPAVEAAFQEATTKWLLDYPKVIAAIENAPFVRLPGLPRWAPKLEVLDWKLPDGLIADAVWRTVPPEFRFEPRERKASMLSTSEDRIPIGVSLEST